MKTLNRSIALAALGAAIAAGVYFAPLQSTATPEVTFTTIEGERLTTADLRGKVVLVNFWASDCIPCLREMPCIARFVDQ